MACLTYITENQFDSSVKKLILWDRCLLNLSFTTGVKKPHAYKSIKGLEHLDKVIDIDQRPIGRLVR